jgi:hypothetical protein
MPGLALASGMSAVQQSPQLRNMVDFSPSLVHSKADMNQGPLILCIGLVALVGCAGEETTQCTTESRSAWQDPDTFQQALRDQGYQINEFKITEGNCYEIYGFDPEQTKVEIYYNPVDGSVVKREEG